MKCTDGDDVKSAEIVPGTIRHSPSLIGLLASVDVNQQKSIYTAKIYVRDFLGLKGAVSD